jgi:hypothetical protein
MYRRWCNSICTHALCVKGHDCLPRALRVQLPTLERLDLELRLPYDMRESELRELVANVGELLLPGGLTALALEAGPMYGLLRHLQLPPGLKAGCLQT